MGSLALPHLPTAWHVDQAILSEEERLVVIRFGRDVDKSCMEQDEVLCNIADRVKNFAVVYVCDIGKCVGDSLLTYNYTQGIATANTNYHIIRFST